MRRPTIRLDNDDDAHRSDTPFKQTFSTMVRDFEFEMIENVERIILLTTNSATTFGFAAFGDVTADGKSS
jgi:hypothetical protein